ncbi:MAG: ABC transporter substrate-binding protein [Gemmatimonadetes bacterium]|nr:ABC transporter substrate-binding protein [Gemmatimonadota bacterium]
MSPTIRVAHSPDSDDAFMFYALAEGLVPTGDRRYIHELADIETLNRRAVAGELEVTAVSIHAYAYLANRYALLPHGASIGDRYGPRLVSRRPPPADPRAGMRGLKVGVPGKLTTAFLTARLFQPDFEAVVIPFDQIEDAAVAGDVDVGLLIHEGQLTYQNRGLHLWADMGEWWFGETGLPLPLGGNVVRRDLGDRLIRDVSKDLKASIVYALAHRESALTHALQYARGLDRGDADKFVGMYVNDFTVDYGDRGRKGVSELLGRAAKAGIIPGPVSVTFVQD